MIIGCPSCRARFRVGPQALGRSGRNVRCAKCGHLWHQSPPDKPAEPVAPTNQFLGIRPPDIQAGSASAGMRLLPTAMMLACGIMFGLIFSLNRIAANDGIPFIPYAFWQAVGAGLQLLAMSFIFRRPPGLSLRYLQG